MINQSKTICNNLNKIKVNENSTNKKAHVYNYEKLTTIECAYLTRHQIFYRFSIFAYMLATWT